MTTQPGDNRFYFFPSVLNPNPLQVTFFFHLLSEDSLEGSKMKMSFECQVYREETSYHMSNADAICIFQTVFCETISQLNYGSGTHISHQLIKFYGGNLVRYPSILYLKYWQFILKETCYDHFYNSMQYKSQCPQNVSVKFQLKIPHRSFIMIFWKCLFWVEAETRCFCARLFKCKWAAAPYSIFFFK